MNKDVLSIRKEKYIQEYSYDESTQQVLSTMNEQQLSVAFGLVALASADANGELKNMDTILNETMNKWETFKNVTMCYMKKPLLIKIAEFFIFLKALKFINPNVSSFNGACTETKSD